MTTRAYDVGLICGRFQTFHLGHKSLVDTGLQLCDRVLILIGSMQESGTERNPFNYEVRASMIKEVYGNNQRIKIRGISDLTNEDDITPDWGRYLLDNVDKYIYKAPDLMIYGNDESRSKWFDPEDIKDTSELIIHRSKIKISATKCRIAMALDKRRMWMAMVDPKLHKMYDTLREELMGVAYYQNMKENNHG